MTRITATKFRSNLFHYLDMAASGEPVIIQKNRTDIVRIVSANHSELRKKFKTKARLLVKPDEFIKPLDDVWKDYE
jgi:prevent-host-death family protein